MPMEYWGCFLMLCAAFVSDIKTMKIPNYITLPGILAGIAYHGVMWGWSGMLFAIKGVGIGFGLMFLMHIFGAVGGGDVKLFAGIGAWTGVWLTLSIMMYSILAAGCLGLIVLLWRREMFSRMRSLLQNVLGAVVTKNWSPIESGSNKQLQMPFMLAVLPGAILAVTYM
ncbi:prepilin peptidase CpaA [Fontibacillus panacisegetis]|uniref:Prepilin peptidase CpaA n=1 Tax=Fontibacillus panacisegetis TaxID=670482 RepID=A0A1G7NQY2_9BACL|nr:A24 family peptidase [Fontibacillus panacisegetis]SDF76361.1 prepilin peptidase CpaA [Fontibacillus panacisegetis]